MCTTGCSARPRVISSDGHPVRWQLWRARGPDVVVPRHLLERRVLIVQGLEIDAFSQSRIDATVAELGEERDTVASLGLI